LAAWTQPPSSPGTRGPQEGVLAFVDQPQFIAVEQEADLRPARQLVTDERGQRDQARVLQRRAQLRSPPVRRHGGDQQRQAAREQGAQRDPIGR
jgi:hypothetical protein